MSSNILIKINEEKVVDIPINDLITNLTGNTGSFMDYVRVYVYDPGVIDENDAHLIASGIRGGDE